jgi:poly(3-hydroxybutyrate) depolymerase
MSYLSKASRGLRGGIISCVISTFAVLCASQVQAQSVLKAYNVDPKTVTVAGISSGGFMAVQLQIAYSSRIFGTAIFAGGPYHCAQGSLIHTLPCLTGNGIPLSDLVSFTNSQATSGTIDSTSNIANKPIYMFSGTRDTEVHQAVMDALQQYYGQYTSASNITFNNTTPAAHAWISPDGPNPCGLSFIPYVNDCNIDPENTFLSLFYGNLNAKNTGDLTGSFVAFDQNAFIDGGNASSISMDSTGQLFVPANCDQGQACRLVIALHGCLQDQMIIQQQFVQESGINEWADTNNIIVLYPQATFSFLPPNNPLGCWDWFAYTGSNYDLKNGPQMKAIMAMVTQITSGHTQNTGRPSVGPVGQSRRSQ